MSQKQIYELEGVVSMEDKNALKKIGRLIKLSDNLRQKLKVEGGIGKPTQEYQQLCKIVDTTKGRVSALKKEQDKLRQKHTNTAEYKQLQKEIANAESELDKMIEEQISIGDLPHGAKFNQLEEDIERAHKRLEGMKAALSDMETGATDEEAQKWFKVDDALRAAEADLKEYTGLQQSMEAKGWQYEASNIQMVARKIQALRQARQESGKSFFGKKDWNATPISRGLLQVRDRILAIASATNPARATVKRFLDGAVNDTKAFVGWLGRLRSGFGSVFQRLKKFPGLQTVVGKRFGFIAKHANKMKRGLMMGAGIKGLVRLGAAGAIALYSVRMLKQGLENLRAYDTRTNASINQMSASLTTLKNALATAFAPILNVVAPILSQFIDWLTAAVTAVAHFMAAMTGQSQVTVARKAISGVSSAASGAADSTNDANDAAKEYQKTLLGFDQINKLDEPVSGSGGSGGGGSGAGGAGGAGSMFETVPVSSVMAGWADKIKEAWKNADFYDLGRELGEKLKAGLEAIPWDKIQAVGAKIGKSIATGLNGFFETPDLGQTIGATIAEALNTIVITVNSFTVNFHWDSFGKFIGDSINGFFKTFDWKLTGQTMSGLAKGILDAAIEAVRTVDWERVGSSIMEMITSIDYIGIATKLVTLLGEAISGAGHLLSGAIDKLKENLTSYIQSGDLWKDLGNLGSAVLDLSVNIVGAAWDLLQSIISFGATVGLALIQNGWTTVTDWVKGKLGGAYVEVSAKLSDAWSGFKTSWGTLTGKLKNYGVAFKSKLSSSWWSGLSATWKTLKGKLKNYGVTFKSKLSAAWTGLKDSWAKLKAAVGKKVAYFKAGLSYKLADLKSKVSDIISKLSGKAVSIGLKFSAAAKDLKKWINDNVIDRVNSKFSSVPILKNHLIPHLAKGGIQKGRNWKPITQYADGGGAARGQLFVAREAGPELVGRIGGNTAVMNNDQIVASVAAGVAKAVASVMGSNSGDVNVYLQGDAGTFFRVMQHKANDYTRATGQPAFPV